MSIRVMSTVWSDSQQEGSRLLLLLALADHASEDGVCWPGIKRLAHKVRLSERQTKRLIAKLEESGELIIAQGRGRGNTNLYLITVGQSPEAIWETAAKRLGLDVKGDIQGREKVTQATEKVTSGAGKGDIAMSPEPSGTVIESSEESSLSTDADFPSPLIEDELPISFATYKPGPGKIISCEDEEGNVVGEPGWKLPQTQVQHQAFEVTGRKRFHSKAEYNKMQRIEQQLENGDLPVEFWNNRLHCASEYSWSFPNLLKYTLSVDKLREWKRRQ